MSRPPLQYRIARFVDRSLNRVGDAWRRVVDPFERFFGRLGEGAFGALDSFEGLESAVVGVLRFVFWPLIAVGRWVAGWMPAGGGSAGPIGRAAGAAGRGVYRLAERLNLDGVVRLLVWLLTPIWWPIASLLGFANAWLATRLPRELALAAPALLLAAPFAYVALQGAVLSHAQIAERYKVAVRDAADAGDYAEVNLLERKLAQMGIDTRRRDYQTAMTLAEDDRLGDAYERMKRLAPLDRPGYPPAHLWVIQSVLSGVLTEEHDPALAAGDPARLDLAERHLALLEEMEIAGPGVARMRAYVYAKSDRLREAADELAPFSETDREAATMRLRLLARLRENDAARDQARTVLGMLTGPRLREPLRPDDYEAWALAAELLNDPRQMESALAGWRDAEPENERPRKLLSRFRQEQAERMIADPTASPTRAADLLVEATSLGASKRWLTARIAQVAERRGVSRHAEAVWRRLVDTRDAPEQVLETLGTTAAGTGQIEDARTVFANLVEAGTELPIVWNNYAWTLIQPPGPDPQAALSAVDRALELKPGDHRFRETRGQVLIELQRWEEAVDDLEYALNGLPDAPGIHASLATAYEALAKPQLAELHRSQAAL